MPLTSQELIAKLEAAGVAFTQHTHQAVMTVEAQEAALAGKAGTVIKNLFLKDKKNRYYIISAVPQTKVDINVLSARLGTGKGGLRMAPEDALQAVLQVPLGSVTPLAIANPEAKDVVLFLDQRIQSAPGSVCVHPLVNTISLEMSPAALEQAVKALGKEPIFVDLEADPKIDRDNPPDLAKYTIAPPPKPDTPATGPAAAPATPEHAPAAAPAAKPAAAAPAAGASGKKQAKAAKGAAGGAGGGVSLFEQHQALTSVHEATQVLLDKVSAALGGESKALSSSLDAYTLRMLTADIEAHLTGLKNAVYAMGYVAGKDEVVAHAQRKFA